MEEFSYFKTLLFSICSSTVFFICVSIFLAGVLSRGFIGSSGSISEIAIAGIVPGIIHGLAMALFLIWRRSDSTLNTLAASILAMEIIAFSLLVWLWVWNQLYTTNNQNEDYFTLAYYSAVFFLYVSVFLLVPAILIGILNRLLLFYFGNQEFQAYLK